MTIFTNGKHAEKRLVPKTKTRRFRINEKTISCVTDFIQDESTTMQVIMSFSVLLVVQCNPKGNVDSHVKRV